MVTFGYVKDFKYAGDGTLMIKVRIPSVHGAYSQKDYNGQTVRNYTSDEDLPWYQAVVFPQMPTEGEVVALLSVDNGISDFICIGCTGGSYYAGASI